MNYQLSLYVRAVQVWRSARAGRQASALRDEQSPLRDVLRRKLADMFGDDYHVEMDDPGGREESVMFAVIENLNFVAVRQVSGAVNISLMMYCPRCRGEMMSDPLTGLADLGRELLNFEVMGTLGGDRCQCTGDGGGAG
jgi:hypothetical protein